MSERTKVICERAGEFDLCKTCRCSQPHWPRFVSEVSQCELPCYCRAAGIKVRCVPVKEGKAE